MKCLLAAAALGKEHPKVHEQSIRFKLALDKDMDAVSSKSFEIIKSEFKILPDSLPLSQYNDQYLAKHKDSPQGVLSAIRVRKLLSPESAATCERDVAAVIKLPSVTLEEAREALELLSLWQSGEAGLCKSSAAAKWPKATVFSAST